MLLLLFLTIVRFMDHDCKCHGLQREAGENNVFIEIEGNIRYPGVYSFQRNTDLKQLIVQSGGLIKDSIDPSMINNVCLDSGKKIRVSVDGGELEISVQDMTAFQKLTLGIPVSINRESEEGLTSLPGIGPGLAKAIVDERKRRGGFKRVKELLDVHGVGERKYSEIAPYITE